MGSEMQRRKAGAVALNTPIGKRTSDTSRSLGPAPTEQHTPALANANDTPAGAAIVKREYRDSPAVRGALLQRERARVEIVNDLDGDIACFWRVLRDHPNELAHKIIATPPSREIHREAAFLW